jgi:hypothetical protein
MTMHARQLVILPVCAVLFATGCAEKNPIGPVPLNELFTLAPGESASISGAAIRVGFLRVSGDSRCPADAFCIQGGDAIVHVLVSDGTSGEYELHTGDGARASGTHGAFRVTLEQLQPYPFSSRTIAPGDYRATLRVDRQ